MFCATAIEKSQSLDDRLLSRIVAAQQYNLQEVEREPGHVLFRLGDKPEQMYFVRQGEVRLERMSSDGVPVPLQRITRGMVAEPSLTNPRYYCEGRCYSNTRLIALPLETLRKAIDNDSFVRWYWIEMLGNLARQQKSRAERLQLQKVRDRLMHQIFTDGPGDGTYHLPGTRIGLAEELGVSPEALYRTLGALQRERILTIENLVLHWNVSPASFRPVQ